MKIYEYIRGENERRIKLFGKTFMYQTSDYMTAERLQSFLGGLITTHKLNDPIQQILKKDIQILGNSVSKRIEANNYRTYYLFGKEIFKISLMGEFKKQYFKYFDKKHDDIYILKANSGEIYLTLTYLIDALIKRTKSNNPLLVATQKYHVDIIKLLCPDIPYVYIDKLNFNITADSFNIDNFRFFILFNAPHFKQVENDIKQNKLGAHHYFKSILTKLQMTESDIGYRKILIPPEDERNMFKKISKTGLNLNKFVFLAPEAQSCKLYDEDFWCELINRLQDKGYDVFVNLVEDDVKLKSAANYKSCCLTFSEAFALAKRAKKIVSLRSGFTEFLLQTETPMDVLYTKFRHRHFFDDMDIYHVMSGFGITQIPFVDKSKIQEFNMVEVSQKECLEKIIGEGNGD